MTHVGDQSILLGWSPVTSKEKEHLQRFPSKGIGERKIMAKEPSQTEIKDFIASTGLDLNVLDERDEALETWRLKWGGLAKGFMNYLQDRFASIEQRLERIEEERYGHQKKYFRTR
jgi:hypothetical protein